MRFIFSHCEFFSLKFPNLQLIPSFLGALLVNYQLLSLSHNYEVEKSKNLVSFLMRSLIDIDWELETLSQDIIFA